MLRKDEESEDLVLWFSFKFLEMIKQPLLAQKP
jgi:hypothetical protein